MIDVISDVIREVERYREGFQVVLKTRYENYKWEISYSESVPSISGIARCFTFGGSRKRLLHDPAILPRSDLSRQQYMNKEEQTTINHFHEKLLKLKDMMKTKVGYITIWLKWSNFDEDQSVHFFLLKSVKKYMPVY